MKRILLFAVLLMVQLGFGQSPYTSVGSGNWNSDTTWSGSGVPGVGDVVNIANGHTVKVTANQSSRSITIKGGDKQTELKIDVTGSLIVTEGVVIEASIKKNATNNLEVGAGSLTAGSITFVETSDIDRRSTLMLSSGTITVSGSIDLSSNNINNIIVFSDSGTLNIGGTISGGSLTPSSGTVNYNNVGSQTVGAYTYNNLNLSSNGTKTFGSTITINNVFSISSGVIADLGTGLTHVAKSLTLGGNGIISGTWGSTSSSATNKNDTFFAPNSGIVNVTSTSCAPGNWVGVTSTDWNTASNWCGGIPTATTDVVIPSGTPFSPIISSGTSAICRNLTVNASAALSLANSATSLLNISGNFVNNGIFTAGTASSISFVGANQNVAGVTYSNLTLSGSGTKTFAANTIINNITSIATGVQLNLNAITTHTTGALLLNGANQVGGTWGTSTSGAINPNDTFFTANGRITVPNNSAIDNDFASYGTTGDVAGTIGEYGGSFTLTAPYGNVLMNVKFASYGTPTGISPNFVLSSCHAPTSKINTLNLLGNTSWSFNAVSGVLNGMYGDPCVGIRKTYSVVATYAKPICTDSSPGEITINGSTPTGGNGSYSYQWEMSTTSATSGFVIAPGISNTRDYLVPAGISQTTWYKRTTTSGVYTSNTIVIIQVNKLPSLSTPTVANVSGNTTICAGNSTTLTVSGGSLSGYATGGDKGGFAEWFASSCGGVSIGQGNTITVSPTSTTTYYVRYTNSCGNSTTCVPVTVTVNSLSVAPTNITGITTICSGSSTILTVNGGSTGTGATAQWFSGSCGGIPLGTGNSIIVSPTVNTTYFVRYSGTCNTTACASTTVMIVPPSITPNKVDETCSNSNNGSISPQLSGGISNVRYIKLSQKYTIDAYQQVAEIQAFEIFTGNNVALSSNGAVATASSVWLGSSGPNYIPSNVNNGVTTGDTFWHSATNNINEWVMVDLQSGKNIDYLRFYNRTSCCSSRGQNMLLELFDSSYNLVYSKSVDLYQAGVNFLEVNVLDVNWTDGANTLNRVGLDSGTYILNYTDVGGCSINSPIEIKATNTSPSAPIIGTITQPTCVLATGSVALSGLPSSGSWTISATPSTAGLTGLTGTNVDNTIIGGLAANTSYTFVISNGTCTSASSGAAVTNPIPATATWNGSAWIGTTPAGSNPLLTQPIIFNGNYTSTGNINGCSCAVTSGNVVINSGHTMTITNAVNVTNNATTSLIFNNTASLVQTNNVTNTGTIEYNRSSSLMKNFDFTYWSSPVAGQNIVTLSPNTLADKYFRYDPVSGWLLHTGIMTPGAGYIIRVPKPGSPAPDNWSGSTYAQPVTFKGVPNNGNVTFTVGPDQYNLIGNPYPSAINATTFMQDNSAIIYGPLYFWTHNTPITNNGYMANDYATFNLTGSTVTGLPTGPAPNPGLNNNAPNGYIAAGQSFFVGTKQGIATDSKFQFTNSMRVSGTTNSYGTGINQQFFKQTSTKKSTTVEKNRVWLNLTNAQGAFKQLLVGYVTGATNDWDTLYDGPSFDGQPFVDFYSINQGQNLTIQGRALPFEVTDVVPLGYRSTIAGPFEIGIDSRDGVLAQQELWLEDKKTSTVHDLTKGSYTFTTINGLENDRFVLKYTNKTLGTDDNTLADKSLVISIKNKKITVTSSEETITQIQIFDLLGRKIYDKAKINAQEYVIDHLLSSEQTLIVKTTLANGVINSQKIIF
ncbi:T9SS sorting signal type C domain-containing protein [Flavobacterium sp. TSSA_36]|uniref:Ig-like domain-containing protein n=1 Tax=Flavobacterium sp. TSSA_36 TaxID=3447669 RepID=UPI003F33AD7F